MCGILWQLSMLDVCQDVPSEENALRRVKQDFGYGARPYRGLCFRCKECPISIPEAWRLSGLAILNVKLVFVWKPKDVFIFVRWPCHLPPQKENAFRSGSPLEACNQLTHSFAHMRVVRRVLVLSYEGEDLLVLALTSAKVPRRGARTLFFIRGSFV